MISINRRLVDAKILDHILEINAENQKVAERLELFKSANIELASEALIYINKIVDEFKSVNFISMSLEELERIKNDIGKVPTIKAQFDGRDKITSLKDEILHIFDYDGKRSKFYPKYFSDLGIKACVYCNSQLTVVIDESLNPVSGEIKYTAKFQLDHFYPKGKYPHLSIALFNLYPVCSTCNQTKSTNENVDFKLYADKVTKSEFSFKLDSTSKALFLLSRDSADLKITFEKELEKNYTDVFKINEIYKTQLDIAEEIILKSLVYNQSYREILKMNYLKHRINDSLINRFILGNYTEQSEIHKRPNAKFMQDIGKEVGLI
ncbi:hypothetical protein [Chryseobacterium sp. PET-29]|uniref:hypothetical protein n=1 Tax=Chryseobacterium sp. PET-29 TaxID=2983267 RepID=UPI0021E5BAE8|nr:hypothetical protein [Chryseobacterium sp. PET-29]